MHHSPNKEAGSERLVRRPSLLQPLINKVTKCSLLASRISALAVVTRQIGLGGNAMLGAFQGSNQPAERQ